MQTANWRFRAHGFKVLYFGKRLDAILFVSRQRFCRKICIYQNGQLGMYAKEVNLVMLKSRYGLGDKGILG
jgi:hypothetical protein